MSDTSILSFPTSISYLKDFIEKTDDDGNLQIYSYKYCNIDNTEDLKKCRGLVYEGETLLFNSLGFTPEYTENDKSILSHQPLENYLVFPSEEGTLIRLFYHKKWYVSTHRKLNAFNSRWGSSKSFGDIFTDYLGQELSNFTDSLDKEYMYLFFIRNTLENRIVSNPSDNNNLYFAGCIKKYSNEFTFESPTQLSIPSQTKLSFSNWDEVFSYVYNVNPLEKQGVIMFWKNETGGINQMKIVNSKYQLFSQVRGNEPNIIYRYIQVRSNPIYSKLFAELYPEHSNTFLNCENTINRIAKNIHNAYISRFVNKNYVVVSQEEYRIMSECHGWHISNRNNKVTLNQVINVLSQDKYALTLYIIIKRYNTS